MLSYYLNICIVKNSYLISQYVDLVSQLVELVSQNVELVQPVDLVSQHVELNLNMLTYYLNVLRYYLNMLTYQFIYLFGVLRRFQHCTGHITTGSWKGRGNQYIQFARVVYCKLPTNGKQLPAFPLKAITGIESRSQRWEARVLPLCHRGPIKCCKSV